MDTEKSLKDKEKTEPREKNSQSSTKTDKDKKERRLEKELLWVIGFLAFLVVLFLIANSFFKSLNQVEHGGITFNKERLGEIPVFHYSYYFEDQGNLIKYNLYVRNDPRTLDVPVYGEKILFEGSRRVYVSLDPNGLQECSQGVLAIAGLGSFLSDNQFDVKSGNPDFFEAGAKKEEWITCQNKPKNKVIVIEEGEETRIDIENNCYRITVSNCKILEAIEKFEIQSVIDAKEVEKI